VSLQNIVAADGASNPVNIAAHADPDGSVITVNTIDSSKATYRFSASFTPQPTAAVTLLAIKGSATKTVRVKRILVGGVSTAAATVPAQLIRTSALGAGGTVVAPTAGKNDTRSNAASAVVEHYTTSLKAAGTANGGPLASFRLYTSIVTSPTTGPTAQTQVFPDQGAVTGQSLVLRGATDILEIQNTNAGNLSAGTVIDYTVELEEDAS
jgi:hypothetical protein